MTRDCKARIKQLEESQEHLLSALAMSLRFYDEFDKGRLKHIADLEAEVRMLTQERDEARDGTYEKRFKEALANLERQP